MHQCNKIGCECVYPCVCVCVGECVYPVTNIKLLLCGYELSSRKHIICTTLNNNNVLFYIQLPLRLLYLQFFIVSDYLNDSFHDEKLFEKDLIKEGMGMI